jgi:hypothetical protein
VQAYPSKFFFVNSNIKTPALRSLNDHSHKAVITVNPDLIVRENEIMKLYSLDRERVAFVRVKYIPDSRPIVDLIQELSEAQYPVVITVQRFNSKAMLLKYARLEDYEFSCSRYRLHGEALTKVHALTDSMKNVHICDRKGLGCSGCGLCAQLTIGQDLDIKSLNMSSSGLCRYSCPDCYSKAMQKFSVGCGHNPIAFDKMYHNRKQKGITKHILIVKANYM